MEHRPSIRSFVLRRRTDRPAVATSSRQLQAWLEEGERYCMRNELARAARAFNAVLSRWPEQYDALCGLAYVAFAEGRWREALRLLDEAMDTRPRARRAYEQAAYMCRHVAETFQEPQEALTSLRSALARNPQSVNCRTVYGGVLLRARQYDAALGALHAALEIDSDHIDAHEYLAHLHREMNHFEASARHWAKTIEMLERKSRDEESPGRSDMNLAPHMARLVAAKHELADVLTILGQSDAATTHWRDILRIAPDDAAAMRQLMGRTPLENWDAKWTPRLQRITAEHAPSRNPSSNGVWAHFALGEAFERLERIDQAFHHYRRANELTQARFDLPRFRATAEILRNVFSERFVQDGPRGSVESQVPIFIVGMPRAGTTLVEQILASHSLAHGGGELRLIGDIMRDTIRRVAAGRNDVALDVLHRLTPSQIDAAASAYLQRLPRPASHVERVIDKLPQNFAQLGFIQLLFPRARVIHVRRHPMATCFSCYRTHFPRATDAMAFAYDLTHLGGYYREYDRLMRHWREILPIAMFELRYEDLVARPEEMSRRLIEFCGLEWEPACLRFYETQRPVASPGRDRVREPIDDHGLYRWRRFEKHLGPLREALGDAVDTYLAETPRETPRRAFRIDHDEHALRPHTSRHAEQASDNMGARR